MNRHCAGTFFTPQNGEDFYRCMFDGTVVKAKGIGRGSICPCCNRKIDNCSFEGIKTIFEVHTKIVVLKNGGVVEMNNLL